MATQHSTDFHAHEPSKSDREQGLYQKYKVRRVDGSDAPGEKHHGSDYFVLDLTHDPFAKAALLAYARACSATHPQLAEDLMGRCGDEG